MCDFVVSAESSDSLSFYLFTRASTLTYGEDTKKIVFSTFKKLMIYSKTFDLYFEKRGWGQAL